MTTKIPVELSSTPSIVDNGDATAITIDSNENVGIGTSTINTGTLGTSNTFLEVAAGTASGSGTLVLSRDTSGNDNEVGGIRFVNANNADDDGLDADGKFVAAIAARSVTSDSNASDDSGANLQFYTKPEAGNYAERMRIASDGKVFIATTTAARTTDGHEFHTDGFARHTVDGDKSLELVRRTSFGEMLEFFKDTSLIGAIGAYTTGRLYIGSGDTGITFASDYDSIYPVNTTTRSARDDAISLGYISGGRFDDIVATNNNIVTSDQNEKNTIADSDLGLDFVKQLSPKSYKFNGKTRTHYGLIAQDVETVLSDINKPTTDFAGFIKSDISEEQDGSSYRYGLRYGEFIAPLIKAIQEQQAIIEDLQTQINEVKNGN